MRTLSESELNDVSGGGSFLIPPTLVGIGALAGNTIIGIDNTINSFQDAIAPIGVVLTALSGPITGALHQFNDYVIYKATQGLNTFAQTLGGTIAPDYHYENEWIHGIN
ncbi:hypothetical protein [Acetobacter orleanensis]|uniref:Uncharacterized protein n=1 Tax=Acetobacter orleanensis TaxID=104099 RepID=A0A4Y3TL67_9PROT|nr:hypothetical protein [Acetobacter orleanensis]KXV63913.1 hypothetical protein AD949_06300 [Acetobacter orleanensis]PCD79684.1 hypothetical protein CO710_05620 [Acetobacter orleanensis]GAN69245.1 hypothetical protein Abol_030_010 [Acetobacter orleanensis JCM 7639]GBR28160.1 hypothetical protein AA0473_1660 [Acetobacter orleanensis NRIC 0473]GEB82229.1 hypothetical protein AOR01nite_07060 [Acetobacter orleanensis]